MDFDVNTVLYGLQTCMGAAALWGLYDFKRLYRAESQADREAMAGQNTRITAVERAVKQVQEEVGDLAEDVSEMRTGASPRVQGLVP